MDHDYVLSTGKVAQANGCSHFLLVSSAGANKDSRLLYTRTKGEVEAELAELGFERLSVLRPGVLMCKREDQTCGGACMQACFTPISKCFPTAITTPTTTVAVALVNLPAIAEAEQNKIYEIKEIFNAAGER